MIFIPNCHWNHTKIEFVLISVAIWYEYHTSVFAVLAICCVTVATSNHGNSGFFLNIKHHIDTMWLRKFVLCTNTSFLWAQTYQIACGLPEAVYGKVGAMYA